MPDNQTTEPEPPRPSTYPNVVVVYMDAETAEKNGLIPVRYLNGGGLLCEVPEATDEVSIYANGDPIIPLDPADDPSPCRCEFISAEQEGDVEGWHYPRRCESCGKVWLSLHCPHDGHQNPCPACGARAPQVREIGP